MEITLKVFVLQDTQQADAQEIGVDIPISECILEEMTFYNIDFIAPSFISKKYCSIGVGDSDFICDKSYTEVKEIIRSARLSKFN